jgi:acyl-coenzyme A thioesterase PaaI-like protein
VAYFRDRGGRLVGRAWFGPGAEGPPEHAHGGSVAAVLDEAMGAAAWMAGYPVVAARLSVDFRRMLPLGTDCLLEAWVDGVEGRKVQVRGRLTGEGVELFAEAQGLFIQLDEERLARLVE